VVLRRRAFFTRNAGATTNVRKQGETGAVSAQNNMAEGTATDHTQNADPQLVEADGSATRTGGSVSDAHDIIDVTGSEAKITCQNVWKLFGPDPQGFLAEHNGNPTTEAIRDGGYIPAVRNVSLDVRAGEILVLMGLSGSGKSTLVRCLSRLVEPTAGDIMFEGKSLLGASDKELIDIRRHKMGMVFQHFALFPHRTVLDNVVFPLEVQGVDKAARRAKGREILELVGLAGRDNYYPRELSGGQQQRVGIGRSLAVEPDVWLLDEPFSALDPLIRREMQDEFLRLQEQLQKTIVFITHDFDEAIRLADRIAIMYEGEVVQIGTAEQLITNPATDYVEKFTQDVAREKLLSIGAVMRPPMMGAAGSPIAASLKLADAAPIVLASDHSHDVIDATGAAIGVVARDDLVQALFGDRS